MGCLTFDTHGGTLEADAVPTGALGDVTELRLETCPLPVSCLHAGAVSHRKRPPPPEVSVKGAAQCDTEIQL